MLFLIDGYNVTRSDPATRMLSLEEQRDALARRLATRGASLLGAGRIVIVFDGVDGVGIAERVGPVEVRYSRGGQSADDAIVAAAPPPVEAPVTPAVVEPAVPPTPVEAASVVGAATPTKMPATTTRPTPTEIPVTRNTK